MIINFHHSHTINKYRFYCFIAPLHLQSLWSYKIHLLLTFSVFYLSFKDLLKRQLKHMKQLYYLLEKEHHSHSCGLGMHIGKLTVTTVVLVLCAKPLGPNQIVLIKEVFLEQKDQRDVYCFTYDLFMSSVADLQVSTLECPVIRLIFLQVFTPEDQTGPSHREIWPGRSLHAIYFTSIQMSEYAAVKVQRCMLLVAMQSSNEFISKQFRSNAVLIVQVHNHI